MTASVTDSLLSDRLTGQVIYAYNDPRRSLWHWHLLDSERFRAGQWLSNEGGLVVYWEQGTWAIRGQGDGHYHFIQSIEAGATLMQDRKWVPLNLVPLELGGTRWTADLTLEEISLDDLQLRLQIGSTEYTVLDPAQLLALKEALLTL